MIKAIIFDFGQTLVDSADGFRSAEKIAKEKKIPMIDAIVEAGETTNSTK